METKCVPTYVYLWVYLKKHLIKEKFKLFLRYSETIFLYGGPENDLQQFISKINEVHHSIKFYFNKSKTHIKKRN